MGSLDVDSLPTRKIGEVHNTRSYVFYGQSGSGKTTLAATFPEPILYVDCRDKGTDSIADHEDIDVMEVETWEDAERIYWFLKKHPTKYATVIVDTMSHLQHVAIEAVLEELNKNPKEEIGWGTMTQKEWGIVASMMRPWITNMRDLPIEVVFIAQHRVFNVDYGDEKDSTTALLAPEVGPALMPSVGKHLNASVAVIGNTFIRTRTVTTKRMVKQKNTKLKPKEVIDEEEIIEYCLRVGPSALYTTKMRKPRDVILPDVIVDPTYEKIIDVLKGN